MPLYYRMTREREIRSGFLKSNHPAVSSIQRINSFIMKSRLRILKWLSLLLLQENTAGWPQLVMQNKGFRHCEKQAGMITENMLNSHIIKQSNNIIMKSRLQILRWLSLLLLSAGLVGWSGVSNEKTQFTFSHFHHPQLTTFRLNQFRLPIKICHQTMKIKICILHWLSLLLLSDSFRW